MLGVDRFQLARALQHRPLLSPIFLPPPTVKGEKGDKGDKGEKGDQGDIGEVAAVTHEVTLVWPYDQVHNTIWTSTIEIPDLAGVMNLPTFAFTHELPDGVSFAVANFSNGFVTIGVTNHSGTTIPSGASALLRATTF